MGLFIGSSEKMFESTFVVHSSFPTNMGNWVLRENSAVTRPWIHALCQFRVLSDDSHMFCVVVYSDPVVFRSPEKCRFASLGTRLLERIFLCRQCYNMFRVDLSVRCGCERSYHCPQSAGSCHHSGDGLPHRHSNDFFDGCHMSRMCSKDGQIKWVSELTVRSGVPVVFSKSEVCVLRSRHDV